MKSHVAVFHENSDNILFALPFTFIKSGYLASWGGFVRASKKMFIDDQKRLKSRARMVGRLVGCGGKREKFLHSLLLLILMFPWNKIWIQGFFASGCCQKFSKRKLIKFMNVLSSQVSGWRVHHKWKLYSLSQWTVRSCGNDNWLSSIRRHDQGHSSSQEKWRSHGMDYDHRAAVWADTCDGTRLVN